MTALNFIIDAQYKAGHIFSQARGDVNSLDAAAKKSSSSVGGMGKLSGLLGGGLVIAAGAAVAAVGGLATVIVSSTEKAANLEAQMSDIAAVMGKTREEVAPLKDLILRLGIDPKLKVSATEAADAIEMLGRNGLSMSEIMDGAARNTVLLSNATGADFGTAADIATDTMSLFNIEAKSMDRAVNGITAVVNNSKFSIDDYRLALAQGGGVAATVGMEFDDFNTTIAAISPLFSSGSDAGTSLKTMMQRLVPQSNEAADQMRKLGLFSGLTEKEFDKLNGKIDKQRQKILALDPESKNYQDNLSKLTTELTEMKAGLIEGNNAFFDQDGNMRSMKEISELLATATKDLSDEQKNNALSTIFGSDAMRAAAGTAEAGKVAYTDLETAAKDLGVSVDDLAGFADGGITAFEGLQAQMGQVDAEGSAATRVDNLKGSMEILSGIVETLQLRIGEKFIPVVRRMVDAFAAFLDRNSGRIVSFFEEMVPKAESLGGAFVSLAGEILDFATGSTDRIETFSNAWNTAVSFLTTKVQEALPLFREKMAEWGRTAWGWLFGGTQDKIKEGASGITGFIIGWVQEKIPELLVSLTQWATAFVDWVGVALPNLIVKLGELVAGVITWIQGGGVTDITNGLGAWVGAMLSWIGDEVAPRLQPELEKLLVALNIALSNSSGALSEAGRTVGDALIQGFMDAFGIGETPEWVSMALAPFRGIVTAVKNIFGIASPSSVFHNIAWNMWQGLINGFNERIVEVRSHLTAVMGDIWGAMANVFNTEKLLGFGANILYGLRDGIGNAFEAVKNDVSGWMTTLADLVPDIFKIGSPSRLFAGYGVNIMEGLSAGISAGLGDALSVTESAMGSIAGVASNVTNDNSRQVDNTFNVSLLNTQRGDMRSDIQVARLVDSLVAVTG